MALVSPSAWMADAKAGGYAVAAFNIHNLETMQAVVAAAADAGQPVILQGTPGTLRSCGVRALVGMAQALAADCPVDLALHADHCGDRDLLLACIDYGFTSLMVDGANLPYDQNVAFVREIGQRAQSAGLCVEGEIGRIGGTEDELTVDERDARLTDPAEAVAYARETGVDSLAIAIGTAHGEYKGRPELDFDRLAAVAAQVPQPLVLHGASGVPDADVRRAIALGICKVNIATELKIPFTAALRQYLADHPKESDPRKIFADPKAAVYTVARAKIALCRPS